MKESNDREYTQNKRTDEKWFKCFKEKMLRECLVGLGTAVRSDGQEKRFWLMAALSGFGGEQRGRCCSGWLPLQDCDSKTLDWSTLTICFASILVTMNVRSMYAQAWLLWDLTGLKVETPLSSRGLPSVICEHSFSYESPAESDQFSPRSLIHSSTVHNTLFLKTLSEVLRIKTSTHKCEGHSLSHSSRWYNVSKGVIEGLVWSLLVNSEGTCWGGVESTCNGVSVVWSQCWIIHGCGGSVQTVSCVLDIKLEFSAYKHKQGLGGWRSVLAITKS